MAAIPTALPEGQLSLSISADGQDLELGSGVYQLLSLEVSKGINRIAEAQLELLDGDPVTGEYPATDAATLIPGVLIDIKAGYDDSASSIFKGLVVSVNLVAYEGQAPRLRVICKDEAVKMSGSRVVLPFSDQAVSDSLTAVVGTYSSLSPTIASTTGTQANLVQYNRSDWDFVVTQAEANGQVVISDGGTFSTLKLATSGSDVVNLQYGNNVFSFDLQVNARTQVAAVTAHSWSAEQQADVSVTANDPGLTTPGNLTNKQLATAVGQDSYVIRTAANVDEATLQALADAYLAKRTLAKVQGTVDMAGNSLVLPGTMVGLDGLGARFNGSGYVSGVRHTISDGKWLTQIELGTDELWFAERFADVVPPAGAEGVASGVRGLYTAVVKATQEDPAAGFRVQVTVAELNDAEMWVRLASPYASSGLGWYAFPEVGDEVVLGFFADDARYPVILGSMYSKGRAPAYTPDEKNSKKALVTSSKLTLEFDEEKKVITLTTPGGNKLVISDDAKGLTLTDQQSNTITMSDSGLALESKSSLSIKAAQDITIESSGGNVNLKASLDLKAQGLNISAAANAGISLKGNSQAELSSSGIATIKGTMVQIN
jgi:Rhs element Vgr protein